MDFENQLTSNISRREDITINDDFPGFSDGYDDFGDGMDTSEFVREGSRIQSLRPSNINLP
jgi:hypothetical protein